jgi:hypothetical protein
MTGEDILFWKNVYVETGFEVQKTWGALAAIAVVAGTLASAFAWTAGWLGSRTVSQALVGETPKPFPPGFAARMEKASALPAPLRQTARRIPFQPPASSRSRKCPWWADSLLVLAIRMPRIVRPKPEHGAAAEDR